MFSLKIASRNFFWTMLSVIALSLVHAQDVLSGRVYVGNVGDESTLKSGVTVRLSGTVCILRGMPSHLGFMWFSWKPDHSGRQENWC
jgi:hypothetical protein